jgi:peptide deformylase
METINIPTELSTDGIPMHLSEKDILNALPYITSPLRIVRDKNTLSNPVEPSTFTTEEINSLSATLFVHLKLYGGVGLSANQIGIDKRICIVNVKEPIVLVNPQIVSYGDKTVVYNEGCISIPKTLTKPKNTIRYTSVTVKTDNLGELTFSADKSEYNTFEDLRTDTGLLEAVVVQHEIDHLNGIIITDKSRIYNPQVIKNFKYGRNDRVMIKSNDGSDSKFLKYKNALPYIKDMGYVLQ